MVRTSERRGAAEDVVEQYADYDDEYVYHQTLIADDQFGTLALIKQQLAVQDKYGFLRGDVKEHADRAAEEIATALDARAEQLLQEVKDDE